MIQIAALQPSLPPYQKDADNVRLNQCVFGVVP